MPEPTTDAELAALREQVADNMADAVVGPLIERLRRAELGASGNHDMLLLAKERIAELEREVAVFRADDVELADLWLNYRAALELVRRAATDSEVTTSDWPGCFYCDRVEHAQNCPAAKVLSAGEEPRPTPTAEEKE